MLSESVLLCQSSGIASPDAALGDQVLAKQLDAPSSDTVHADGDLVRDDELDQVVVRERRVGVRSKDAQHEVLVPRQVSPDQVGRCLAGV